jgi:hypothetical protein
MLQRTVEQLRASLDAEKRSAAASHRRMVSEQSELIKQLRAAQGRGSGTSLLAAAAMPRDSKFVQARVLVPTLAD